MNTLARYATTGLLFLILGTSVGYSAESECTFKTLSYKSSPLTDDHNANAGTDHYSIEMGIYDAGKDKGLTGGYLTRVSNMPAKITNKATHESCKLHPLEGPVAKMFIERQERYVAVELSDGWAGQAVTVFRLNDCEAVWRVDYAHFILPNRIERRPFCAQGNCFGAVFVTIDNQCQGIDDQEKERALDRDVFGQTLPRDPMTEVTDQNPIGRAYLKYRSKQDPSSPLY